MSQSYEFAAKYISDVEYAVEAAKEMDKIIDEEAAERAAGMAHKIIDTTLEQHRIEIINEIDAANAVKRVTDITRSCPYVSEFVIVNGKEVYGNDFILHMAGRTPLYDEEQLIYIVDRREYQLLNKNGRRNLVSNFFADMCVIVDATGPGECRCLVVYLQGVKKPLFFYGGDISCADLRRQTRFLNKGLRASNEAYLASFIEALRNCTNILFLNIPKHAGRNLLQCGSYDYTSSSSVISELEELYPDEIKQHKLIQHNRTFEDIVTEYKAKLPSFWKVKLAVAIRIMSILLPYFGDEELKTDRIIVFTPRDEYEKEAFIALAKRNSYSSTVVNSISERITNVRKVLSTGNDITVIFTYLGGLDVLRSFENGLKEIRLDITGENGVEYPTRKIIILITDVPGRVPDDFPAYFFPFTEELVEVEKKELQFLSGAFDYSLIQFLINNPDSAKMIIKEAVATAKELLNYSRIKRSDTLIMLIATTVLIKKLGLVSGDELQAILNWFGAEATSRTTMGQYVAKELGEVLSKAICSGDLKIANQFSPPYWTADSAFLACDDSLNVNRNVFDELLSLMHVQLGRNKTLQYLNNEDVLFKYEDATEDQKTWTVETSDGKRKPRRFYSFSRDLLSPEANKAVDEAVASDIFFIPKEHIENLYPMVRHMRLDLVAGQKIRNYSAINPFVCVNGSPSFGKTDLLHMQALVRADAGDTVIIFDATNSSCHEELKAHMIPDDIIDERFLFWDMSRYGWPFELMDFSGCDTDEQKIQRLSSWLLSGSHMTGSSQISIIMNLASDIVHGYEKSRYIIKELIDSLLKDTGKEGEVKKRLLSLFSAVANHSSTPPGWEDVVEFGTEVPGWKKILSLRGKIIVISTGNAVTKADCNALDIVLDSFYGFKDRYRDSNVTLIFDEIQRMNLEESAPLDVILSTGRKLNISAYIATQRYSENENAPLGRIEGYCDTYYFFNPKDGCANAISAKTQLSVDRLNQLEQGEFAFMGPLFSQHYDRNKPLKSPVIGKTYRPPYVGDYDTNKQP